MYDEYGTLYVPPGYGRIRFGRQEIIQIFIAVAALTFAFFMIYYRMVNNSSLYVITFLLAVSAIAVITGFLFHELMHKFLAQRYGAWAEFRIFPLGLLLAVFSAFLGFVFAAPGAVYIQGRISDKQNGMISAAGPLMNLAIGSVCTFISLILPLSDVGLALQIIGSINLFLAVFNLFPIPPLDGSKVLKWNIGIYAVVMGAAIMMLLVNWGYIQF